ncbi:hypothetical protein DS884_15450 [Tenacibaculum sp. E3R01]|uniref:DUF3781 domain-containing protein n=1 Tax=Tenacibaculum sp. E3R01 TaxID=2267227 RepID=UPI000DEABEAE|nr:hypothetical protein DS884_15450 [Tenacibaculum sp. E3R01]
MIKEKIIKNICYTELVYNRINKKLNSKLSKKEIESYILKTLKKTDLMFFEKKGKNYYVTNSEGNIRITVNSNTFSVITVNSIVK